MFNKWGHNIDFPVFLSGLNIHSINVGSEFLSAVCQRGSSVNKTPAASVSAHHSIISPRVRPLPVRSGRRGPRRHGTNSWLCSPPPGV